MDQVCWNTSLSQVWQDVICGILEIIVLSSGIYLGWIWYKFRKYFPLAERSPILSIFFLFTSMAYLLTYPAFVQIPYLQHHLNSLTAKCILIPLGNTYTYIYLIKSIRLAWGFNSKPKQDKFPKFLQCIFNTILSRESILCIFCLLFLAFNAVTSILPSSGYYHEFDFVQINQQQIAIESMTLTNIIENSIGLTYLLISIMLVRRVDERVNFLSELYLITVFDFVLGGIRNILLFFNLADDLCVGKGGVALLYILNAIKLISTLYIGMVRPMQQLNTEHKYQNTFIIDQLDYFLHNYSSYLTRFMSKCIQQKQLISASSSSAQSNDQFKSKLRMQTSNLYTPISNHPNNQSAHTPSSSNNNNNSNDSNNNNNNNNTLTSDFSTDSRFINRVQLEATLGQSHESERTREIFLRRHDFNLSLIYFQIYQESLAFKQKPPPNNPADFLQAIKTLLAEQKRANYFNKLFPQSLLQRVNEWLEYKGQESIQNQNGITQQQQQQQHGDGQQGILEQDNRTEEAEYGQLQQATLFEIENQNTQSMTQSVMQAILEDVINHSQQQLQQIFNEYKKTISFKTLQLYLEELSTVYTHILKLRLAYDQNTTI